MTKRSIVLGLFAFFPAILLPASAAAQLNQICGETGGSVWLSQPAVFGRVTVNGLDPAAKFPKITVILTSRGSETASYTIDRSGNFCFRGSNGTGGTLTVEVEGAEAARVVLPAGGNLMQYRQDFEVMGAVLDKRSKPASVSVKYQHPRTEQSAKLFQDASVAALDGNCEKALQLFREIVAADPADFIAWSQIGAIHFEKKQYSNAEKAYRSALEAKSDLAPAMMNLGRIRLIGGEIEPAIAMLKRATETDPSLARAFQLLGEAYLLAKKGTLGVEALNEAIRLEPVTMAESHLLLATLYDRAGAKYLATREYKLFLEKVPEHKDAKRFKRYIEENPDTAQ